YEGFGLPVIEAMACGTAVVCANTSSLPEAAGDAALLFEPTRVDAIAKALGQVLEDENLRALLREKGLAQAKRFTWERVGHETLEIYRAFSHKT
ncbi:MAG TPA: glycosyltransferase, partial [Anaerolineales bacterium]|nr:glycosyltransferase [Anaerolineales bacterium]